LHARGEPISCCPVMDECLRSALLSCGGFFRIGQATPETLGVVQAEFRRGFQSAQGRARAAGARFATRPLPPLRDAQRVLLECKRANVGTQGPLLALNATPLHLVRS